VRRSLASARGAGRLPRAQVAQLYRLVVSQITLLRETLLGLHHARALESHAGADEQRFGDLVFPTPHTDRDTSGRTIKLLDQLVRGIDIDRRRPACTGLLHRTGGTVCLVSNHGRIVSRQRSHRRSSSRAGKPIFEEPSELLRRLARFCVWLAEHGWHTRLEVEHVDIVADRGNQRLYAEAKGRTAAMGLDVDALYGQLLRRMPAELLGTAVFAVVVPESAVKTAERVPTRIRELLGIEIYGVDDVGAVRHAGPGPNPLNSPQAGAS
jgi:hypothetical protein